jgi:putative transposase
MSRTLSPSTGRRYGIQRVAKAWRLSRATIYRRRGRAGQTPAPTLKRGPKPALTDTALLEQVRATLTDSPFLAEGYRKAWARLRDRGVRVGPKRVLRVMREAGLLAPTRASRELGPRNHDGTIVTERPNQMWGTDATCTMTVDDGQVTVFVAIDHCSADCVGIHAAKPGTRFEALEPLRQGIKEHLGGYGENVARGLAIRHDHGSQYMSDVFQDELRFLGAESSPAFVRSPEGNGCIERFIRTLKEQLLWVRSFRNAEELRLALLDWKRLYNERWLIQRHGHLTPSQARAKLSATIEVAA